MPETNIPPEIPEDVFPLLSESTKMMFENIDKLKIGTDAAKAIILKRATRAAARELEDDLHANLIVPEMRERVSHVVAEILKENA